MGVAVNLRCAACGHEQGPILMFGGYVVSCEPMSCSSCRRIVSIEKPLSARGTGARACPDCGGAELLPWGDDGRGASATPCPACGSEAETTFAGHWD